MTYSTLLKFVSFHPYSKEYSAHCTHKILIHKNYHQKNKKYMHDYCKIKDITLMQTLSLNNKSFTWCEGLYFTHMWRALV